MSRIKLTFGSESVKKVYYAPVLAAAMGLMMLRPLVMAHIFDAAAFATYVAGLLISSSFCVLGCLGMQPLLQRSMPRWVVNGKERQVRVVLLQSILVALATAIIASCLGFTEISLAGLSSYSFFVSVIHGFSQQIFLLSTIESRSRGQTLKFSVQNLVRAIVVLTFSSSVAMLLQSPVLVLFTEAVISILMASGILIASFKDSRFRLGLIWKSAFRGMGGVPWKECLALMITMLAGFGLTNLDRWFAVSVFSTPQFALYGFAWILLTASQAVQTIINSSVYPSLAKRLAVGGQSACFKLAAKSSILIFFISGAFLIPSYVVINYIVPLWYAKYSAALSITPFFLIIALFRVSDFWSSYLIIIKKEQLLIAINAMSCIIVAIVLAILFRIQILQSIGPIELSISALGLTMTNYIFVLCVSYNSRG